MQSSGSRKSEKIGLCLVKDLLSKEPKVPRTEGLKITYEYFKSFTPEELHEKDHNTFEGYVRK